MAEKLADKLWITQGAVDKLRALGLGVVTDGEGVAIVEVGAGTGGRKEEDQRTQAARAAKDEGVLNPSVMKVL